jgi:hypothetical protein
MDIITVALLVLIFVGLSATLGFDSRPTEHDRQHNW